MNRIEDRLGLLHAGMPQQAKMRRDDAQRASFEIEVDHQSAPRLEPRQSQLLHPPHDTFTEKQQIAVPAVPLGVKRRHTHGHKIVLSFQPGKIEQAGPFAEAFVRLLHSDDICAKFADDMGNAVRIELLVVVVGNGNGVVGYGLGKAKEVTNAIVKGVEDAKKNLVRVPILRNTVPHASVGKFGGGLVLLKPAAPGTGIIAGGGARIVLESAGVQNVLSKSKGSSNPHNVVKATLQALLQLRDPVTVAAQRGIHIEKVFNG